MEKTKSKKANRDECRFITPEFRVAYPHLFKPQAVTTDSKPKFSITMLVKKTTDMSVFKNAMRAAKIAEFGPNQKDWPTDLSSPVINGDDPKFADKEGYAGCWIIKATTGEDQKPSLVDENVEPIIDQAIFYPGCYARAYVYARVWKFMGKQGVQLILDHVQKMRDGKSFSGKKPVDQIFTPVNSGMQDDDEGFQEAEADFI